MTTNEKAVAPLKIQCSKNAVLLDDSTLLVLV